MLKKYIKILAVFLSLPLLFSCSGNDGKVQQDALAYSYETVERKHPICDDQDPNNGCMKISFTFPRFTDDVAMPVKDSLRNAISSFLFDAENQPIEQASINTMVKDWFAMYDSTRTTLSGYNLPWELRLRVRFIHRTSEYLSVEFGEYEFTGGAHENELRMYRTYSIPKGKRLTLSDLLQNNAKEQLTSMAEALFRNQKNLSAKAAYEDYNYFFKDGKFSLNNNYALTNKGLLFYYNSYEIAPFSEGPTRLLLSYEHIDSLLTDPYKPSSFVNNKAIN